MIGVDKLVGWLQIGIPLLMGLLVISLCLLCLIGLDTWQERMRRRERKRHKNRAKQ